MNEGSENHFTHLCICVLCVCVDSESSLKMMKMLLKKLNIVADTAENGRIALDMIMGASEPYHLVFMDNLMPEMVVLPLPLPLPLLPSHPISKAFYITYG